MKIIPSSETSDGLLENKREVSTEQIFLLFPCYSPICGFCFIFNVFFHSTAVRNTELEPLGYPHVSLTFTSSNKTSFSIYILYIYTVSPAITFPRNQKDFFKKHSKILKIIWTGKTEESCVCVCGQWEERRDKRRHNDF